MADRTELLEAALNSIPDGVALLGGTSDVVFWNRAAEAILGYASIDLLGRPIRESLEPLILDREPHSLPHIDSGPHRQHGVLARARHKLGHEVRVIAQIHLLRDELGGRIGTAAFFHPAERLDALPCGEATDASEDMRTSQTNLQERLESEFEDFEGGGPPFGVLWIAVDQAHCLRKTHGAGACEAMLEKVGNALSNGLRPAEELGRWGDDEFLVISHERTPEMLAAHAQTLAGLARTADFRWWGDRVSLTVSIGAAQADAEETLAQLLDRARGAMQSSTQAGGNQITPGRNA
jgi:diguanylate cyclase (GGDEF)-like protein/PAS domain S-box-containing protein